MKKNKTSEEERLVYRIANALVEEPMVSEDGRKAKFYVDAAWAIERARVIVGLVKEKEQE